MEMKKVSGSISSFSLASGELYCSAKPDTTYYRYQLLSYPSVILGYEL